MKYLMVILFFIFTLNLNGVLSALTGGSALASPLILLLLFLALNMIYKKQLLGITFQISSKWIILLSLYFILGMLSLVIFNFYNEQIGDTIRNVLTTILIILTMSGGLYYLLGKYPLQKILGFYVFALIISASSVIIIDLLGFGHIFNPKSFVYRQSGFFGNPNEAGHMCAYTLLFILFKLTSQELSKLWRMIYLGCAIMTVYASLLTLSKTSMATCLVLLGLYFILNLRKNFKTLIVVAIAGTTLFLTQWSSISENMSMKQMNRLTELENLMQGEIDDETTSGRSEIASYGWNYVDQYIITGIGLGNFKSLPGLNKASHNSYLVLWGESGIFPLMLFLILLIYQFRKGYIVWKKGFNNYGFLLLGGALIITTYGFATNNLLDFKIFNCSLSIFMLVMFLFSDGYNKLNPKLKYDI